MVRKNDVYHLSCVTVVYFVAKNEITHSVHVITKWLWKAVGVGEEEPIKNFTKTSTCISDGWGVTPNTGKV